MQVVYLSAVDWSFRRLPHHYICDAIADRGGRILFVENTGSRWPAVRDLARVRHRVAQLATSGRQGMAVDKGRITVVPPFVLPSHRSTPIRHLNRWMLERQLRRVAPWLRSEQLVAWVTLPNWTNIDLVRSLRPRVVVYYCADEFVAVPGIDPTVQQSEDELLRMADVVLVSSQRLKALCSRFGNEPLYFPVGVDTDAFADAAAGRLRRPSALDGISGRIIGYLGGLNHKVDVPLLERVMSAFPDDTLVILGDIDDPRHQPAARPNLRILSGHSHAEVPAFLQYFDVCLIPYKVNRFTHSVYPAKLNEYLAAGRPVVSTGLPETEAARDVIRLAYDAQGFITQIQAVFAEGTQPEKMSARVAAAQRNDYSGLIPPMLDAVERRLEASR